MSETFVIDIANGDAVQNKIATTLNQAGSSPTNPILKGLGTALNVKFSPDVNDFEITYGRSSPAEERILSLEEVDSNHYRLRQAAGEGDLGFPVSYASAQRHFVRVRMATPSQVQGTEREMWIQEDPLITAFLCSAQFAWCDDAAAQYYKLGPSSPCNFFEGIDTIFNNDPGKPPTGTIQDGDFQNFIVQEASGETAQVELGPDRVIQFGIYGTGAPGVPITIPITIMENWRDEFNIKHFGGAKYVSIFESDLAEDVQGTLITNQYQEDITTVSDFEILTVDPDTEYVLTFRFRSELNDPFYVDKQVRFRVVTADMLTRNVTRLPNVDDAPVPIFDEDDGEFYWSDDDIFTSFGGFSVVEAWVLKGAEKVSLPTDTTTPFSTDWFDHRKIIYGGPITIQFRRETFFFTEVIHVTYDVRRPNGANTLPITFEKNFGRQDSLVLGTTNFTPDTQFRLLRPMGSANVFLEVLNVQTRHVAAIFWTDKGSMQLDAPLKAGARYDVTTMFDIVPDPADPSASDIAQGVYNIALITDHQIQLHQEKPVAVREFPVTRTPPVAGAGPEADFVFPTLTPDYPDLEIKWPIGTDAGDSYEIAGLGFDDPSDPSDPSGQESRFFIKGRKGIVAVDGMVPGGSPRTVDLSEACYPQESTFEVVYTIDHTFANDVHYVLEKPTWLGYDAAPPDLVNTGALQMIAWAATVSAVFTVIPPNFIDIEITGNLGMATLTLSEIIEDQPIDLSSIWDGVFPTLSITYNVYNPTLDTIENFGPFTVAKFESIVSVPTTEINLPRTIWRPSRLVEFEGRLPKARIDQPNKRLTFDYAGIPFSRYTRFKTVNPNDRTQIIFEEAPFNRRDYDIRRMFRNDSKNTLQIGQSLLVTFLHETGASKTALYKISGEFEDPTVVDDLRGQF